MHEQLLSKQEIEKIIEEATTREKRYLDTIVLDGKATETSIHTISPVKRVIFTEGNEQTVISIYGSAIANMFTKTTGSLLRME